MARCRRAGHFMIMSVASLMGQLQNVIILRISGPGTASPRVTICHQSLCPLCLPSSAPGTPVKVIITIIIITP